VFGIALVGAAFAALGGVASPQVFSTGFAWAITASAALSLVAAVVALALPGRRELTVAAARANS